MANSMEYCSFVSVDYIICECGDNFSNEEDLRSHLEQCQAAQKEEPTPTANSSNEQIFLIGDPFVKMEPSDEPVQEPVQLDIKQENIIYDVEINEFNQIVLSAPESLAKIRLQIPSPEEDGAKSRTLVVKEPSDDPFASTQVTFKLEAMNDKQVVLVRGSEEHDYDKEAPKPNPEAFFCELGSEHGCGREAHGPDSEGFFCELCGKAFHTARAVHQHISRLHSKRPPPRRATDNSKKAVCDVCGKHYASNAALRYHQRVHTGEKPYHCTWCPKAFTMPLFLQIHLRTHTGERPYACSFCPKAFSNKAALLRHDRVHTGVKPYACPECGKSFSQSNSMKLHVHTVHLKLPAPYKSAARRTRQKFAQRNAAERMAGPKERRKATGDVKLVKITGDPEDSFEYVVPEQTLVRTRTTNMKRSWPPRRAPSGDRHTTLGVTDRFL